MGEYSPSTTTTRSHMFLPNNRRVDQQQLSLEGVRVLVVEDTWHVAKALKAALEQVGMDVSGPAATTVEARRIIAEHMPRVAVVDVNLKHEMASGLIEALHDPRCLRGRCFWLRASADLDGQIRGPRAKAVQRVRVVISPSQSSGASPDPLKDRSRRSQ